MISAEEKLLLLSLRILKVASGKTDLKKRGLRVAGLSAARMAILESQDFSASTPGNIARLSLTAYLSRLSEKKLREAL